MDKLGKETRFLLYGTTIIFIISILLSFGIALLFVKDYQSNLIMHDYEIAGYLFRDNQSTELVAAFTKKKNSEDLEAGRVILEAAGYTEHTDIQLLTQVQAYKKHAMLTIFIFTFSVFLMIYILLFLYIHKQKKVLSSAKAGIRGFLNGNIASRIDSDRDGDLYSLFHEINQLTTILETTAEQERRTKEFLKGTMSDISHQLKTPLTALKMYHEIIDEDYVDSTIVLEFNRKSAQEIKRIEDVVYIFLKLTKLDVGMVQLDKTQENLSELLSDVVERFEVWAVKEHKSIQLSGDKNIMLDCDALWLSEAIGNIVKNALEHTRTAEKVLVRWEHTPLMTSIIIEDNGKGIHPDDIHNIFKRFYRSRFSQDTQGSGLGLPLSKAIIEAHGGMLSVKSNPGSGSVFLVDFFNLTKE